MGPVEFKLSLRFLYGNIKSRVGSKDQEFREEVESGDRNVHVRAEAMGKDVIT